MKTIAVLAASAQAQYHYVAVDAPMSISISVPSSMTYEVSKSSSFSESFSVSEDASRTFDTTKSSSKMLIVTESSETYATQSYSESTSSSSVAKSWHTYVPATMSSWTNKRIHSVPAIFVQKNEITESKSEYVDTNTRLYTPYSESSSFSVSQSDSVPDFKIESYSVSESHRSESSISGTISASKGVPASFAFHRPELHHKLDRPIHGMGCRELSRADCCKYLDGSIGEYPETNGRWRFNGQPCQPAITGVFASGFECEPECFIKDDCPWDLVKQTEKIGMPSDETAAATTCPDRVRVRTPAEVVPIMKYMHQGTCKQGYLPPSSGDWRAKIRGNVMECAQHCEQEPNCGYFAYNPDSGACPLYAALYRCHRDDRHAAFETYALIRKKPDETPVSYHEIGNAACGEGKINGQDALKDTLGQCATYCQEFPICRYFSYNHNTGSCMIYNAYGFCPMNTGETDHSSFIVLKQGETFAEPRLQPYYFMHEGKCGAGHVQGWSDRPYQSMTQCIDLCYKESDCRYFSWIQADMHCVLYEANLQVSCSKESTATRGYNSFKINTALAYV